MTENHISFKNGSTIFRKIALPVKDGLSFISIDEIIYLQSNGNFTFVHFCTGKKMLITKKLKLMEAYLSSYSFIRIHNQYLINIRQIIQYEKGDGGQVVLLNGVKLPVSRDKKAEFLAYVLGKNQ